LTNIARLVAASARRHPGQPAITDTQGTVTYGDFIDTAARLAGGLRSSLQPGARVLLFMENRREFFEGLFAAWWAGMCAVPANSKLHPREVAGIAGDCGSSLILCSGGKLEALQAALSEVGLAQTVVSVDSGDYRKLLESDAVEAVQEDSSEPAWLFYTSGTTGKPKGAMLSHDNLLAMSFSYFVDITQVQVGDQHLICAAASHGAGLYAVPHLLRGGHQIIQSEFDVPSVLEALQGGHNVTTFLAPTMLTRLINSPQVTPSHFEKVDVICYGGSPMYLTDLKRAIELIGQRMCQTYGQGESPMTITALRREDHVLGDDAETIARLTSCGHVRTGQEVKIVNDDGQELAPGELGEIVTRGPCVMSGYWGDPDKTAATLKDGWLLTGDIGFIDEHGYLSLRDRSKDVIISGGSNIYPREVEELLLLDQRVSEVCVVGRPHPEWGEEVVAFVVPRDGKVPSVEDLDRLCLDHIARYKRPKEYRVVNSLPKNNYGKVLKKSLRADLEAEISRKEAV
jgi:long-chain acyl-CoA synthetase